MALTAVEEEGKRELLLLPGFLCDESVWADQADALAAGFVVRIVPLRVGDTFTEMAQHALAQMSGDFLLAGHSMGAKVALEILRLAPERVRKAVLLNTSAHSPSADEAASRQHLLRQAEEEGMPALAAELTQLMLHPVSYRDQDLRRRVEGMIKRHGYGDVERQLRASLSRPEQLSLLPSLTQEILLISSDADQWTSEARHREMLERLPQARLHNLEHCGHMSTMERPTLVSALLWEWFVTD